MCNRKLSNSVDKIVEFSIDIDDQKEEFKRLHRDGKLIGKKVEIETVISDGENEGTIFLKFIIIDVDLKEERFTLKQIEEE